MFYAGGATPSMEILARSQPTKFWVYSPAGGVGYGLGGLWVLLVWLRHWHSCTTTID